MSTKGPFVLPLSYLSLSQQSLPLFGENLFVVLVRLLDGLQSFILRSSV